MSTNKLIARLHRPLIRTLVHAGAPDSYPPSNGPAASPSDTNSYEFTGYKSCFMYDELAGITGGFSAANVIGEGGLIVPEGDADALAAALSRLRSDPDLGHALGQRGRRRVLAQYTHASIARETVEVYRQVMEQ